MPAVTMPRLQVDQVALLRRQIVRVASGNVGYGEEGGNNLGPFLKAIGAPQGANWCAYFAWYCIRRGAQYAELAIPGFRGSGNARRLGRAVARCPNGVAFTDPALVQPGDLVVLERAEFPGDEDHGHVRIAVENLLPRITQAEGNAGRYPAKVRFVTTDPTREPRGLVSFYGFR